MINLIEKEFNKFKNEKKASELAVYFRNDHCPKDDTFIGATVPQIRGLAKKYWNKLDLNNEVSFFISSKIHEYRLFALQVLIEMYNKAENKKPIVDFYMDNLNNVNDWDLVDFSCYKILGDYLYNNCKKKYNILLKLSKSKNLWGRRTSLITTMYFIKNNYFEPSLKLCKELLYDKEGLIQKAVGWVLREVGKKDIELLYDFLTENIHEIKSISLNYAMEKFAPDKKEYYKKLRK